MKKEFLEQKDFIEVKLIEFDPSRKKKKAEESKGDESGAENIEDSEEDRNPKGKSYKFSSKKQKTAKENANKKATQKKKKKGGQMKRTNSHLKRKKSKRKRSSDEGSDEDDDEDEEEEDGNEDEEDDDGEDESIDDDDEGEEDEEDDKATLREEIENEDLSKSKYVPFFGSSWLDQIVTQRPLFFGNRLANPIEVVPLTLKLENVCVKMDASLEEQIRTKVNYIRPAENGIDNDDQSVTILSRTLHVFVHNTHKMLSEKPLSIPLVKGKASSMQRKDGKKMNVVNNFPPSKAKKTSFVRFCYPHPFLTLCFLVEFELLIPILLPRPPVSDGSFCSSIEGRFENEAPKVMIPDKVKKKVCVWWKEFSPFEASSEGERLQRGRRRGKWRREIAMMMMRMKITMMKAIKKMMKTMMMTIVKHLASQVNENLNESYRQKLKQEKFFNFIVIFSSSSSIPPYHPPSLPHFTSSSSSSSSYSTSSFTSPSSSSTFRLLSSFKQFLADK
ncbi:uncharacterized protein MONOS_9315 [Monocercomonoides exilis]|uniref:uncharacterized protein n=1 Tax=Monocercomonoides exilis TaxID=2049356 RepID=UPI003559F3D0|nr:hypothetical protein MONOS_9315 [Monocercomonoides exilis]|eukprot:MONOS_9315.1-p1 / transcript=MONOS_9315.1 / gene=MONOS_9315 / organism=Monocercomonoides_exilis_PA203 / gene_product=unspecified product / transcript_product=unspecified product / location=Mono_scaffold00380:32768-34740(+) / protein_length=502 / sequence_SO=supercontig / SO=protein_coding / is_pseudo=false